MAINCYAFLTGYPHIFVPVEVGSEGVNTPYFMSIQEQGELEELIVMKSAAKQGLTVSIPYGGHTVYDLVFSNAFGKFYTAQVKKAYIHEGYVHNHFYVEVIRRRRKKKYYPYPYLPHDFDFLIACDTKTEDCWIIPLSLAQTRKRRICLTSPDVRPLKNNWIPLKKA